MTTPTPTSSSPMKLDARGFNVLITAKPLDREAFAMFGEVVENPRPDVHPSTADIRVLPTFPHNAVSANQGSALKYQHVTRMRNLYDQAPSGRCGLAVMNLFVCAARRLRPLPQADGVFPVSILERHPFTTQTFVPLTPDPSRQYLVIVAPSLAPGEADQGLPVPTCGAENTDSADSDSLERHPGRGLPDLSRLQAFVASAGQAVTYGAGTWHAPMVALGPPGSAIDFVVVQFSNGVAIEDCQEVILGSSASEASIVGGSFLVRVPEIRRPAKL